MRNLQFRDDRVVEFFRQEYKDEADRALAEAAVIDLVRRQKISAMAGADLLGLHLTEFVTVMARHDVPYFTEPPRDPEELLEQYRAGRGPLDT